VFPSLLPPPKEEEEEEEEEMCITRVTNISFPFFFFKCLPFSL
jgi:hypothetical protein